MLSGQKPTTKNQQQDLAVQTGALIVRQQPDPHDGVPLHFPGYARSIFKEIVDKPDIRSCFLLAEQKRGVKPHYQQH